MCHNVVTARDSLTTTVQVGSCRCRSTEANTQAAAARTIHQSAWSPGFIACWKRLPKALQLCLALAFIQTLFFVLDESGCRQSGLVWGLWCGWCLAHLMIRVSCSLYSTLSSNRSSRSAAFPTCTFPGGILPPVEDEEIFLNRPRASTSVRSMAGVNLDNVERWNLSRRGPFFAEFFNTSCLSWSPVSTNVVLSWFLQTMFVVVRDVLLPWVTVKCWE